MNPIPHNRPTYDEAEEQAVVNVIRSGMWAAGDQVKNMEAALCDLFGLRHAAGVSSGLAALRLALKASGVGEGDKVLVPAYSCVALANAVMALGAIPIPIDVIPGQWTIDPKQALAKTDAQTKAIIAVNTFGFPAVIDELKSGGITVIEDCAHGFNIENGARADIVITSFYATKLIAGGEGGAVIANDKELIAMIKDGRDYADKKPDGQCLNDKMTDIEAALVQQQIKRLPRMLRLRNDLANRYNEAFSGIEDISVPLNNSGRIWYRYTLKLKPGKLQKLQKHLKQQGICACAPVECWLENGGDQYPVTKEAFQTLLSLPLYPTLSHQDQDRVIRAIKDFV